MRSPSQHPFRNVGHKRQVGVEIDVVGALDPAVSFRRDDGFGAGLGELVDKMVNVIALVGDRHVRCETIASGMDFWYASRPT
jgi:hypothetical protein